MEGKQQRIELFTLVPSEHWYFGPSVTRWSASLQCFSSRRALFRLSKPVMSGDIAKLKNNQHDEGNLV